MLKPIKSIGRKKFIFGVGSGKCGTVSFAKLLELNKVAATHEKFFMPWEYDCMAGFKGIAYLYYREAEYVADSAFYWINYIELIRSYVPSPKVVCLKRDRDEVVNSWMSYNDPRNYWTSPSSKYWGEPEDSIDIRMMMFPKYDLPKKDAIIEYWDEYYRKAEYWQSKYPEILKIYSMHDVLNTEDGQRDMFKFVGMENPIISLNKKYNEQLKD